MEKEDLIKKIVSLEFGRFLAYYANAPEIEKPSSKKEKKERKPAEKGHKAEKGYRRLFINLGKDDGFYPGEVMQFINRHVSGRQEVGHIDLFGKFSYIEVPEEDAELVMESLDGTSYHGRQVRCNDADEKGHGKGRRDEAPRRKESRPRNEERPQEERKTGFERFMKKSKGSRYDEPAPKGRAKQREKRPESGRKDDWRQFFQGYDIQLRGEEPDFSEEGWARRRPKKKK